MLHGFSYRAHHNEQSSCSRAKNQRPQTFSLEESRSANASPDTKPVQTITPADSQEPGRCPCWCCHGRTHRSPCAAPIIRLPTLSQGRRLSLCLKNPGCCWCRVPTPKKASANMGGLLVYEVIIVEGPCRLHFHMLG